MAARLQPPPPGLSGAEPNPRPRWVPEREGPPVAAARPIRGRTSGRERASLAAARTSGWLRSEQPRQSPEVIRRQPLTHPRPGPWPGLERREDHSLPECSPWARPPGGWRPPAPGLPAWTGPVCRGPTPRPSGRRFRPTVMAAIARSTSRAGCLAPGATSTSPGRSPRAATGSGHARESRAACRRPAVEPRREPSADPRQVAAGRRSSRSQGWTELRPAAFPDVVERATPIRAARRPRHLWMREPAALSVIPSSRAISS